MRQSPSAGSEKGFFAALLDLSFESFVARKLASGFYAIALGVLAFTTVLGIVVAGQREEPLLALGVMIGNFVLLVLLRLFLETVIVLFVIAEHTSAIASKAARTE